MNHKPPWWRSENQKGCFPPQAWRISLSHSWQRAAGKRATLLQLTFKACRPEELMLHALELLPLPLQLPLNGVRNSIHKMEA